MFDVPKFNITFKTIYFFVHLLNYYTINFGTYHSTCRSSIFWKIISIIIYIFGDFHCIWTVNKTVSEHILFTVIRYCFEKKPFAILFRVTVYTIKSLHKNYYNIIVRDNILTILVFILLCIRKKLFTFISN